MESFGIRITYDSPQLTYLIPLSLGISSISLLHVLDHHIEGQLQKSGRAAYGLHVLYVDMPGVYDFEDSRAKFESIKERYPKNTFSTVQLLDALDELEDELFLDSAASSSDSSSSTDEKLDRLLASATSPTARTDIFSALKSKIIVAHAKRYSCDAILWGDSTTRLAEKTLSETAKGRGFALPWIAAEGESRSGVRTQYPVRDLLKKELVMFAEHTESPLTPLIAKEISKPAVSAKNTTIDELTSQYFESVERDYPSIVANVVRTTAKLDLPTIAGASVCQLCDVPITESQPDTTDGTRRLCSNCARALGKRTQRT